MTISNESVKICVTIGLLTYNNEDTLVRALESLVHQDYAHKELVIFDDCSTDRTYEICQDYAKRFSFIRLFQNEKNVGCFENLNLLLSHIRGEYFLWACPDDTYEPTFLTKCARVFSQSPKAIIVTSAIRILYDTGQELVFRYDDFEKNIPFSVMTRNIVKMTNSRQEFIGYNSIIHTLVRTAYLPKICCGPAFIACEELWTANALIWGEVAYIDEVLFDKYESSVPYAIRNPLYHAALSPLFSRTTHALKYAFHFLKKNDIPWSQKKKYLWLCILVLRFRAAPLITNSFFSDMVQFDKKYLGSGLREGYKIVRNLWHGQGRKL